MLRPVLTKLTYLAFYTPHWVLISVAEVSTSQHAPSLQPSFLPTLPLMPPVRRWTRRSSTRSAHGNELAKSQRIRKPTRRLHVRASGQTWLMTSAVETLQVVESQQSARSSSSSRQRAKAVWCFHSNQPGPYLWRTLVAFVEVGLFTTLFKRLWDDDTKL